ncbi:MAG: hypothetical protein IMF07_04120 [Proteobacteria bacterium]|nr:hypothetical protein [Pseudomonadota bacterium]
MKIKRQCCMMALAFVFALVMALPQTVLAVGTQARTTISNEATVDYSVNTAAQPTLYSCETSACNNTASTETTDFLVDRKVNFTVTNVDSDPKIGAFSNTTATFEYEINNLGNDWFSFDLSNGYVDTSSILDNGLAQQIFLDDGDNVFEGGGDDILYASAATFGDYSANEAFRVWVTAKIDADAANGDTADNSLTAVAREADNANVTGDTLGNALTPGAGAGTGDDYAYADAGNDNSEVLASMTWQIGAPVINVQKTDGVHASSPFAVLVPGAYAEYTITISYDAAGSGTAGGISISDNIPANTRGVPNLYGGTGDVQRSVVVNGGAPTVTNLDSGDPDLSNWGGSSAQPAAGTGILVNCGAAFVLDSTTDSCTITFAVEIL